MPTAKKAATIDQLTEKLGKMTAAAVIEYRGLTVAEMGELRSQLRPKNVEVQVTKNTLLREAARRNSMVDLDDLFSGPNAVAFIYGDEASGSKAVEDYFKSARVGEIKAGLLPGGRQLSRTEFKKLAELPNRETLLAQIAGLLESPLSNLANLFNAPMQQFAYALGAFEQKGGAGNTPDAPTAQAPAAEATAPPIEAEATIPAQEAAEDTSSAPESEGSAATLTAQTQEATPDEPENQPAQVEATDTSSAPESEGGVETE